MKYVRKKDRNSAAYRKRMAAQGYHPVKIVVAEPVSKKGKKRASFKRRVAVEVGARTAVIGGSLAYLHYKHGQAARRANAFYHPRPQPVPKSHWLGRKVTTVDAKKGSWRYV